jgi:BolA protein
MTAKDRIERILADTFGPTELEVVDESHLHQGHSGYREGGESHFRVRIAAKAFAGKSRIEAHRMINQALAGEFAEGMHALAIEARAA